MEISLEAKNRKLATISVLRQDRLPFWNVWRDLANYLLPSRYVWLESAKERAQAVRNSYILDSTGTRAARTLAAGMMNGITSPARPWFKLRLKDFEDNLSEPARVWLDECERRLAQVMAESNFYNSLAVSYLDLSVFGTACTIIYDDPDKVIHCHNAALGEFYLMIDRNKRVCGIGRELEWTVYQVVQEFGEENCSTRTKAAYKAGGARLLEKVRVTHLIEPNDQGREESLSARFAYREFFWEDAAEVTVRGKSLILRSRGYIDFPGICPRWDLAGNDAYGTSPGMDALGDVIQLQHETKAKAKGLDKALDPPMLADIQLQHKPTALLPRSITYVSRLDATNGMRPAYQVQPAGFSWITEDLREVQTRIRETFFNFLFNDISQIDTVRSATEIAARKEEKLILLGPVLERFENECLDPAIRRIFGIMARNNLLPPAPPEIRGANLSIQYVSILAAAQSAVGTVPTERLLEVVGNLVAVFPEARLIPDIPALLLDYAKDIGVKAKNLHSADEIAAQISAQNAQNAQQQQIAQGQQQADIGQTLSQTEVGGGANAAQLLLGRG